MLKKTLADALNNQINEELFSSYLYLSMSAYLQNNNLAGFAHWMKIQAQEEYIHSLKFYDFILQRGAAVNLKAIKAPKTSWKNVEEVVKETLAHEIHITNCINSLISLAQKEMDHASQSFLKWFVDEQVEEVANAEQLLNDVKMIGNNQSGLFLLDRELKGRAPALTFNTGPAV